MICVKLRGRASLASSPSGERKADFLPSSKARHFHATLKNRESSPSAVK
jgi:hypothetical protein